MGGWLLCLSCHYITVSITVVRVQEAEASRAREMLGFGLLRLAISGSPGLAGKGAV